MALAFSPLNSRQLAIGSDFGVLIVDLPDKSRKISDQPCRSVAFSPDGRLLATGVGPSKSYFHDGELSQREWVRAGHKGLVALWDVKTGNKIIEFKTSSYINSVAFSPDGKSLAAGCKDGSVLLWKVEQ